MSDSWTPTLLALPRELRNEIYEHLVFDSNLPSFVIEARILNDKKRPKCQVELEENIMEYGVYTLSLIHI